MTTRAYTPAEAIRILRAELKAQGLCRDCRAPAPLRPDGRHRVRCVDCAKEHSAEVVSKRGAT